MRKIKVLYLIDYLSIGGGTENQLRKLIRHIDKDKFEVSVVVLKYLDWEGFPEYADPGCPHICLHVESLLKYDTFMKIIQLSRYIKKNNIDIIHTFFFDSNLIGVIAAFLSGRRKVVVSRRDLGFWYTKPKLLILRFCKFFSDMYLVNAEAIKQTVMKYENIPEEKVSVIYNGFFELPDNSPSPISKQNLQIPEEAFVIGIVANLREVKRLDFFIELATKIKTRPLHFLILGNGPLKVTILEQAKTAGLENRLQILHTLDSIFDYIKLFDIGVLTSESEGLSNTLIEYQLCGKPAVAFDVGGNREVISQDLTGYVVPAFKIDEMANTLDRLLTDRELRLKLGKNAQLQACQLFLGNLMIDSTEKLYRKLLKTGA